MSSQGAHSQICTQSENVDPDKWDYYTSLYIRIYESMDIQQAQLVNHDRKGTWHYYFCNEDTIRSVQAWMGNLQTSIEPADPLSAFEKDDNELGSTDPFDRP